jgi:CelD/BcsL family acetyltransferase involved in cellulose biosynthesis
MTGLRLRELQLDVDDDEWRRLALEVGNIFATPEWITTWWRHFGSGRLPLVTACRDADGRLVGVLPLYEWKRRPLRVARFLGHGPGDALGPICLPSDQAAVASALDVLLAEAGAVLLVGDNLPGEEGWSDRLHARVVQRESSPVLTLDGRDWETLLASWSKNLRSQVRSRERKLAGDHEVRFRLTDDPERLDQDLDQLFALHRARWPDGSNFARAEAFQRDFAVLAFARGWFRLWLLEVQGDVRAAWYGFRFANVESYYQAGRDTDPDWDRYHLGFVVLAHSIREAAIDGAREYRFLRGDEPFKHRFATHDHGLETIVLAQSPLGALAVRAALAAPRRLLRRFVRP